MAQAAFLAVDWGATNLRASVVGGDRAPETVNSYLSGLLIGAEVAALPALMQGAGEPVALVGDARLCRFYQRALEARGVAVTTHDGDAAALAGLNALFRACGG